MNQMTATAEAAIRSRIGAVSGLQIEQILTRIDTGRPARVGQRIVEVDVTLSGWSCSLHQLKMRWRESAGLRTGATGIEQARATKDLFALRIAKQMERLQQGIAMGHATPMSSWMPTDEIPVMHLVMDRASAEMMAERDPDRLIHMLQESVMNLHQEPNGGLGDEIVSWQTLRGRTWTTGHSLTDDAIFHGDRLWVRTQLPETVLTACTGMRLGEIVEGLPRRIADRAVTSASASEGGTDFGFAGDNATVQRIVDEWSGAAAGRKGF